MGEMRDGEEGIEGPHFPATVLVVDDDIRILGVVALMLSTEGYRVLKAAGAEEAVRVFEQKSNEIDLLLSDVVMPGMSGPELETRLHQVKPSLPVILMTGNSGYVAPPGKILEKPFHMLDLFERVSAALAGSVPVLDRSCMDWTRS
jgi:two-component system cell cycle sensor histidine kinase/response regulator CckA